MGPPASLKQMYFESRCPLLNSRFSPINHILIDDKAFTRDVYMKVNLEVLGYDWSLLYSLQHFSSLMANCYYQEVTSLPIFSIDFGSSIGCREVKVSDTWPNKSK
jgi:hypothetical protein